MNQAFIWPLNVKGPHLVLKLWVMEAILSTLEFSKLYTTHSIYYIEAEERFIMQD